jgi:hypothetical protein
MALSKFYISLKITGMRYFFLVVLAMMVGVGAQAQGTSSTSGAIMAWDKNAYDFGDIEQGEKVEFTFRFSNTGTEPLIITNVTTQCGCTTPKGWPRDPVLPGGSGEITLSFNSSGKNGRQNKVATIVSNAVNSDGAQLVLSGNVQSKKPQ